MIVLKLWKKYSEDSNSLVLHVSPIVQNQSGTSLSLLNIYAPNTAKEEKTWKNLITCFSATRYCNFWILNGLLRGIWISRRQSSSFNNVILDLVSVSGSKDKGSYYFVKFIWSWRTLSVSQAYKILNYYIQVVTKPLVVITSGF